MEAKTISPAHHIGPHTPPTLILHGKADTTVPYASAVAFESVMKQAGRQCKLVGYGGPRLGGISFLHRIGSALNHHVHLHACVTDGVFVPAAAEAACDTPPAFLPARPITQADLATLTERVRRRVIRWFRRSRLLDTAVSRRSGSHAAAAEDSASGPSSHASGVGKKAP